MLDPSLAIIVAFLRKPLTAGTFLVFGMTTMELLFSQELYKVGMFILTFLVLVMNFWERYRSTSMATLREQLRTLQEQLNTVQEQFRNANNQLDNEVALRSKLDAKFLSLEVNFKALETDYSRLTADTTKLARAFLEMKGIIAPDTTQEMAQRYANPQGQRVDLLIVEDHPSSRLALSRMLLDHGVGVSESGSMADALAKIQNSPLGKQFDVILLDLMLPDGNGAELLRIIREKGITSRVVLATGSSDKELIDQAMQLQPVTFLPKPLDISDLLAILGVDRRNGQRARIAVSRSVEHDAPKD